jgi:hypothetical protein
MQIIPLTQGRYAIVDDCDWLPLMLMGKWCYSEGYAVRCSPKVKMHRAILELAGHDLTGLDVDHKSGEGLDNRIVNLRPATHAENVANSRKRSDSTSGFKGVSYFKRTRKWRVQIRVKGKQTHVGYFTDKIEAAKAYDAAALTHFGEFARLNFPPTKAA